MEWSRVDDTDSDGNLRVTYAMILPPGTDFMIRATKFGVQLSGTTPFYTDYTQVQEKLSWSQYQHQRIKETNSAILQRYLDEGCLT